jgi:hypothetical protein
MDYVSEKVFEAIFTGTTPIYVGPAFREFGIPEDLILRAEPEYSSILSRIDSLNSAQHEEIRAKGKEWINSLDLNARLRTTFTGIAHTILSRA